MKREIDSPAGLPTVGKVTPAIEGDVTTQQLLDAMAHMAHDIDVLRVQVAHSLDKSASIVADAERARDGAAKHASEAAAIVASLRNSSDGS